MSTRTVIIPCAGDNCEKKLRIPSDRGRLILTCPACKTTWEWVPSDYSAPFLEPVKPPRVHPALTMASALLLACGVWNRAWLPTSFLLMTALAWWGFRRKALMGRDQTFLRKGSVALWEAFASVAGAAAVGFASVIALVTFLNGYAGVTPSSYPSWLPSLESGLVGISAWLQNSANKSMMAVTYIVLILLCIFAAGWARRHNREWRPVKRLSNWKQLITKAAVALQAFTFFTFFSQAPINEHALRLEQQLRWRYGVAKRAEQELDAKRLLAEQLQEVARDPERRKEDRDDFAAQINELRRDFTPPNPASAANRPAAPPPDERSGPPPFAGSGEPPPGGPVGWHPPSWPRPPDYVRDKFDSGKPLTPDDYRRSQPETVTGKPTAATSDRPARPNKVAADGRAPWEARAETVVVNQIESAEPSSGNGAPPAARTPPDPVEGMVWPIRAVEDWEQAKVQVAAQEAKADAAERRYGQAVQGALEALCEYIGLQVNADPVVEAWLDLTIDNLSDRVYGYLFSGERDWQSRLVTHVRRLLSPKETAAEKLVAEARARINASDYEGAERLVGELLIKYPKTKASKQARSLAEESGFQRVKKSYTDVNVSWEETIKACSDYLDDHYDSPHSEQVRQWLDVSKREKAKAEIDARTPRMFIYVKAGCGNSQYFQEVTSQDPLVVSAMEQFRHEVRYIHTASAAELAKIDSTRERVFPIIIFENRAGELLGSVGGGKALEPDRLLIEMQAARHRLQQGVNALRIHPVAVQNAGGSLGACRLPPGTLGR